MGRYEIEKIVGNCKFPPWTIVVRKFKEGDRFYLQVRDDNAVNNVTGEPYSWGGRKWALSEHMTETEIVKTALVAVKAATEHETLEKFTYCGVAIFDPHIKVSDLLHLREKSELDGRD